MTSTISPGRQPLRTGFSPLESMPVVLAAAAFAGLYSAVALAFSLPAASLLWPALALAMLCLSHFLSAMLLLAAAMLLSPELRLGNGLILRFGDVIVPLLCVGMIARLARSHSDFAWRRAAPSRFMAGLLAVLAASSAIGVESGRLAPATAVLWNLKMAEMAAIYWLTLNLLRTPRQVRQLLAVAGLVYVAVMAYALFDVPFTELYSARRLSAPFEGTPEPTTLGGYLTIVSGVVIAIALYEPSRAKRALWWTLSAVCMVPLLYTFSRTSYITYAFVLLCLGLLARRAWLVIAVALVILMLSAWGPAPVLERVASTFDSSREHGVDPSLWERIDVWSKVRHSMGQHPLFGQGFPQPILDSQFARILIESGLAGLLAWLGVFGSCARLGMRLFRRTADPLHKGLALGYLAAIGGLLVHSTATTTFYIARIMEPFWMLTGVVAFLDCYERRLQPGAQAPGSRDTDRPCAESAE